MKFKTKPLADALGAVIPAADLAGRAMPILSHVHITTDSTGRTASLRCSDLQMEMVIYVDPCGDNQAAKSFCLPAAKLRDILRAAPADLIDITPGDTSARIVSGSYRATLPIIPGSNFPEFARDHTDRLILTLEAAPFRRALRRAIDAAGVNDVRYYLNGVGLDLRDAGIDIIGSDGHRLALSADPVKAKGKQERPTILPRDAVAALLKLIPTEPEGEIELEITTNTAATHIAGVQFATKLIDSRYVDVRRLLTGDPDITLTLDRDSLASATRRTMLLADDGKLRAILLQLADNTLTLRAGRDESEAEETIINAGPGQFRIGINADYLITALDSLTTDTAQIDVYLEKQQVRISEPGAGDRYTHLIVPMAE